jgi:drug/metabolite transporter (DMT)-like permease
VSVAAVLGSLHPVVTILIARALLDERLRSVQAWCSPSPACA